MKTKTINIANRCFNVDGISIAEYQYCHKKIKLKLLDGERFCLDLSLEDWANLKPLHGKDFDEEFSLGTKKLETIKRFLSEEDKMWSIYFQFKKWKKETSFFKKVFTDSKFKTSNFGYCEGSSETWQEWFDWIEPIKNKILDNDDCLLAEKIIKMIEEVKDEVKKGVSKIRLCHVEPIRIFAI